MITDCDDIANETPQMALPLVFTEHGATMPANVLKSGYNKQFRDVVTICDHIPEPVRVDLFLLLYFPGNPQAIIPAVKSEVGRLQDQLFYNVCRA